MLHNMRSDMCTRVIYHTDPHVRPLKCSPAETQEGTFADSCRGSVNPDPVRQGCSSPLQTESREDGGAEERYTVYLRHPPHHDMRCPRVERFTYDRNVRARRFAGVVDGTDTGPLSTPSFTTLTPGRMSP